MELREFTGWNWLAQDAELKGGEDRPFYFASKRLLDICLALAILLFLAPLMIIIAILVKLDSAGPVIFIQQRVGSRRKRTEAGEVVWQVTEFSIFKYRSMKTDADDAIHRSHVREFVNGTLVATTENSAGFKLADDPRITRVGKILRKFSFDELPQLFNVLKGDMSLVGPRPVPTYEVECYEDWHHERFAALPGITGLWQVQGRGQVTFEEMIVMDLSYIRQCSTTFDFKIILLTIPAICLGRGAQ